MKTHIEYLVILYFLSICIPSKCVEQDRSKVVPSSTGSGPSGLLWVTEAQWDKLPGGRSNNPLIKHWDAPSDAFLSYSQVCAYIGQIKRDGCWQTGCVPNVKGSVVTTEIYAANNGKPYTIYPRHPIPSQRNDKGIRFLVNPGNSIDIRWVEGKYGKPFPSNSVFGDKTCDLRVATYLDSANHKAPWLSSKSGRAQGAQVDKDGYVYWPDDGTWYWDSNEYKLLTTIGIKKYHIISMKFKEGQGSKRTKRLVTEGETENDGNSQATQKISMSRSETESSHWDHSISWNVQQNGNFEISAGPDALAGSVTASYGYAIDLGGQHSWGKETATVVTTTKEVEVTVPAKSRKRAKMIGKMSNVDLPYEAKVRLTYDDGTERIVTDIGKWRGVFVSDFKTFIEEAEPI